MRGVYEVRSSYLHIRGVCLCVYIVSLISISIIWGIVIQEYIRKHESKIIKNAKILYSKKANGSQDKVVKYCLDFKGVEKLCDKWIGGAEIKGVAKEK